MIERFTLLRPWFGLALFAIIMVGWQMRRMELGLGAWDRVANPVLLRAMTRLGKVDVSKRVSFWCVPLIGAILIVLALMGPASENKGGTSFRNLDAVVFVVDTTVAQRDPQSWTQLVSMGRYAVSALKSRPAALVLYAGDAYVGMHLTRDHLELGQMLSLVNGDTIPDAGNRPNLALEQVAQILAEAQILTADVLLFGDGEGFETIAEVQYQNLRNYQARLSLVTPQRLGKLGDIRYHRHFYTETIEEMLAFITHGGRAEFQKKDYPFLFWNDWGRSILLLALLMLLPLFRRRGI